MSATLAFRPATLALAENISIFDPSFDEESQMSLSSNADGLVSEGRMYGDFV